MLWQPAAIGMAVLAGLPLGTDAPRPRAANVDATVIQVDLANGKELSRAALGRERSVGPMVVGNGVLVLQRVRCLQGDGTLARGDSEVTGTDPRSGATRWRIRDVGIEGGYLRPQAGTSRGAVLLVDTFVARGRDKQVHLVDVRSGKVRWSRPATTSWVLGEGDDLMVVTDEPRSDSQAPSTGSTRRVEIRGVDRTTGRNLWTAGIDDVVEYGGERAVINSGLVVVGITVRSSDTGRDQTSAHIFDARTGASISSYAVSGTVVTVIGDALVTSQMLRSATGYETKTGREVWARPDLYASDLASARSDVLLGSRTNRPLQWIGLDPTTGATRWSLDVEYYTGVLSNGDVGIFGYAGPGETAVNLADGSTRWTQSSRSLIERRYFDDEVQPALPRAIGTKVAAYGYGCALDTAT